MNTQELQRRHEQDTNVEPALQDVTPTPSWPTSLDTEPNIAEPATQTDTPNPAKPVVD